MPGTMVDCCFTQELEEVANRLLPTDIFAEIGTATTSAAGSTSTCSSSHAAVIEGLTMHLISILGLADMTPERQPLQANTILSNNQLQPSNGEDGTSGSRVLRISNGGMPGFGENDDDTALRSAEKTLFAASSSLRAGAYQPPPRLPVVRQYNEVVAGEFRPARRRQNGSGGTGVFFPRARVWRHARSTKSAGDNNNCAKPPRFMWKEAPMTMMKRLEPKDVPEPRLPQKSLGM